MHSAPNSSPCVEALRPANDETGHCRPEVLLLSTSLLTDRMLFQTRFLDVLAAATAVRVWTSSVHQPRPSREASAAGPIAVQEFPKVRPFREFPYNYLRRLDEFAWDFRQRTPTRLSLMRHIRDKTQPPSVRAMKVPARAVALLAAEQWFENWLERLLLSYPRSPEAVQRLKQLRPDLLVTTGPFWFLEPGVVAAAKTLGIPCLALIPSWDNLSTKNRMIFKYDGYLVWSEQAREELYAFYPSSRSAPAYVVGAPQFDVFFQRRFYQSRENFCRKHGLRAGCPIILYAIGSPNLIHEHHGALYMAERVARGEFGDVQLVIRPHPIHDNGEMNQLFGRFGPRVVLQQTGEAGLAVAARRQDEDQIAAWVNTFRHADVVVNLSSTVAIDAAIMDRPVVNLDYDPEPGQPNQGLVKDINHTWTHFKPVAESGGVWLVNNPEEMVHAVKTYLRQPELHREKRRWIAEYVCGYLDGRSGERMAQAVLDFLNKQAASRCRCKQDSR